MRNKELRLKGCVIKNKLVAKEPPHHFINGDDFSIQFIDGYTGFKEGQDVEIIIRKLETKQSLDKEE